MQNRKRPTAGKLILRDESTLICDSVNPLKQKRCLHEVAGYRSASVGQIRAAVFNPSPQKLKPLAGDIPPRG
jgi:hypothetical protein